VPGNLLVLALIAGFCFIHSCYRFKFRAQMLDGYRLLFHCSVAGAIILAVSRALVCFFRLFSLFWKYRPLWNSYGDIPYLGTFVLCIPVGIGSAKVWNLFVSRDQGRESAVETDGDSLMSLMQKALNGGRMLSITLESRKWYAGYLVDAPDLRPSEKYFSLLPVLSGYRDKDTLEARRTLRYDQVYEKIAEGDGISPEDFVITLPLASVRTANLFDLAVYEDHFSGSRYDV
jgi:hypothetical protein